MKKNREKICSRDISRREILKCGLFGLAGLSSSLFVNGCSKSGKQKRPNIILVILDTTRADHLGCYGYERAVSPNLDKLASESVLYTQAVAPSSWTLPSHASLFTGKFVSSHGAEYDVNGPLRLVDAIKGPEAWNKYRARGLSPDELTVADILKDTGYATSAVVGGPWMKKVFGLNKGFEYYDDNQISTLNGRLANQVTTTAITCIEQSRNKKFFLFLNYFDPHFPYLPPQGFVAAFLPKNQQLFEKMTEVEKNIIFYDGEIRYMDYHIGRLVEYLKADNLYDNSMIIVTADHGELFGEHGKHGHGDYLWQEEIHIPLFIKYPAGEVSPRRSDLRLQLTDILPLICERVGIAIPEGIQGNTPPKIKHPILAETYPLKTETPDGAWRAMFEGNFKFLWNSEGNHQLYHLGKDPAEEVNLIEQNANIALRMSSNMEQYLAKLPKPSTFSVEQELDEETINALKSLGYIE